MEIDEIVDKTIEYARQFPNASNQLIKEMVQEDFAPSYVKKYIL